MSRFTNIRIAVVQGALTSVIGALGGHLIGAFIGLLIGANVGAYEIYKKMDKNDPNKFHLIFQGAVLGASLYTEKFAKIGAITGAGIGFTGGAGLGYFSGGDLNYKVTNANNRANFVSSAWNIFK
ncbi:MAG: hypothetical protein J0H68_02505 [Sphingobacteriia bacterium]|nr:hypothetical protein [Sphingobacteriia bacterium]